MQYIVLDLEYNQLPLNDNRNFKKSNLFEIIEIGAVKVDSEFNIKDTFRVYIKPFIYKYLNKRITKLTHINKDDLAYGFDFNTTIKHFKNWIGEEDSILCLWANDDIKVLAQSLEYFETGNTLQDLFTGFIDVQAETSKYLKLQVRPSLTTAIEKFELPVEDKIFHRALDDAYFTAQVMQSLNKNGATIESTKINFSKYNESNFDLSLVYNKDNKIKYEKKEFRLVIKCPLCGKELPKEYIWRNGNKLKFLGTCIDCDSKILHYSNNKKVQGGRNITVYNQIISVEQYNSLSGMMVKSYQYQESLRSTEMK